MREYSNNIIESDVNSKILTPNCYRTGLLSTKSRIFEPIGICGNVPRQ